MVFFKWPEAWDRRSSSSAPPPRYDSIEPAKCETLEEKPTVELPEVESEPMIKVNIDVESSAFMIPVRILKKRAPRFLEENRKSETLVSCELLQPTKWTSMIPTVFAHWLRHETLPKYDFAELARVKDEALHTNLNAIIFLFYIAENFKIANLMDEIMDALVESKYEIDFLPHHVIGHYKMTSGPCGLRYFAIRALVYHIYTHSTTEVIQPLEFEILSKSPELMKDVFQEFATQGFAGAQPKHPMDYPACSYHHQRFPAAESGLQSVDADEDWSDIGGGN